MASPDLSRDCIRDTLLVKRDGALKSMPSLRTLYAFSIRRLRETQLAPYHEPWHENRILDMQTAKEHPPEIIIFVRCGRVEEVFSTNPNTLVEIADYDCDWDDKEHLEALQEAEERINQPDMHSVY